MLQVDGLITLLNKERDENARRKHLVVSQFSSFLDLLEKPLTESGYKFVRLDGKMSMQQRNNSISLFSTVKDSSPTIMLLSLKAGGLGINLTKATRVFLMDPVIFFIRFLLCSLGGFFPRFFTCLRNLQVFFAPYSLYSL